MTGLYTILGSSAIIWAAARRAAGARQQKRWRGLAHATPYPHKPDVFYRTPHNDLAASRRRDASRRAWLDGGFVRCAPPPASCVTRIFTGDLDSHGDVLPHLRGHLLW